MKESARARLGFLFFESSYNTSHMSHLEAYSEVDGRVEFRADFLRQIVAQSRRILPHKFRALVVVKTVVKSVVSSKFVPTSRQVVDESRRILLHKFQTLRVVKPVVNSAAHTVAHISDRDRESEREEYSMSAAGTACQQRILSHKFRALTERVRERVRESEHI